MDTQPSDTINNITLRPRPVAKSKKLEHTKDYQVIGFGQCGWVYHSKGLDHVVKIARKGFQTALETDYTTLLKVCAVFDSRRSPVNIPVPIRFAAPTSRWWKANNSILLRAPDDISRETSCALLSQRIPPMPKGLRDVIIDTFCPAHKRQEAVADPKNEDALARVYLGRRRTPGPPLPLNFSLRNYNLTLDQMLQLNAPVADYARKMGEALCIMHWAAFVDGYGVEFVLGGRQSIRPDLAPSATTREQAAVSMDVESVLPHAPPAYHADAAELWVLDFDLCSTWDRETMLRYPDAVVEQLVRAFFENDSYYPLPFVKGEVEEELWDEFSEAYVEKARSMRLAHQLPRDFIRACERRAKWGMEKGLVHDFCEHKQ